MAGISIERIVQRRLRWLDVDFRRRIVTILKTKRQRKREIFDSRVEPLAQSVEHRPFKPRVAGSIPARLTSPHRLVVRTPLFQGGNGGSIPPEGTTHPGAPLLGAKLTGLKAGLAQRKSACLTSKRSLVQVQHPAPAHFRSRQECYPKRLEE